MPAALLRSWPALSPTNRNGSAIFAANWARANKASFSVGARFAARQPPARRIDQRLSVNGPTSLAVALQSSLRLERLQSCCAGKDSPPGAAVPHGSRSTKHYGQRKFCGPAALGWG